MNRKRATSAAVTPRSLRTRVSLALVGMVAALVVLADIAVFAVADHGLRERIDAQLSGLVGFAAGMETALDASTTGANAVAEGMAEQAANGEYVGVLDAEGRLVVGLFLFPADRGRTTPVPPAALGLSAGAEVSYDTTVRDPGGASIPYRVRARRLAGGATAMAAIETQSLHDGRRRLLWVETAATLALLALLALFARRVVRVSLAPLTRMEDAARRIATGDLAHRVEPAGPATEITRLGATLNHMLDQIDSAFRARRESEQRLIEADQRMRRFASDASHELRTPLTSILGYAHLLRAGEVDDLADVQNAAGRIEDEARRLQLLAEDLLILARLDEGAPLRRSRFDLSELVGEVVDAARIRALDRVVGFESAGTVDVEADEFAVRRALTNLVDNACRHTPDGGPIEVVVAHDPGAFTAEVRVIDHGNGLDPVAAETVFDRFTRGERSRSRDSGGSGLGLSVVKAIASAHGGTCTVEPTVGGGATFVWVMPLRADEGA